MSEILDKIEIYSRDQLKDLLAQCTEPQQKFFLRMYPLGADEMPQEKIPRAIEQCEATIKKNNAEPLQEKTHD